MHDAGAHGAVAPDVAHASSSASPSRTGGTSSADVTAPAVMRTDRGPGVRLPAAMTKALRVWNPEFSPLQAPHYVPYMQPAPDADAVPWAAVGDFDGDGKADAALMGRTRTRAYLVAVLTGPAATRVVVLKNELLDQDASDEGGVDEYLSVEPPGRHGGGCDDGPVVTTRWPAVGTQVEGKGGTAVHYWNGTTFASVYDGC